MPFNALNQYVATHKVWDHVGNIIPNVEHSEGVRPSVEWRPAPWLPLQWRDKYFEDFFVVMPGKCVALDNSGDVVPAQYGLAGASIVYAQDDVDNGVIDVRTGLALTATATVAVSAVSSFMGLGAAMAVSAPIGVCPYGYLQWAGGDGSNPANLRQHNYNRQHQVAVLCDYVLELPLVPARLASAEALTFAAPDGNSRSDSTAVASLPVARNTTRTPIEFTGTSAATRFANEVSTRAGVLRAGDWFVNRTTGVITVFNAGAAFTGNLVRYYHYAAAPTTVSRFACAVGSLVPGDFVRADANSNFEEAAAGDNFRTVLGQVLALRTHPRDALERVRTAWNPTIGTAGTGGLPGSLGQLDQMPGSATGGYPDNVHYAGASDTTVLINLISR